jgi:hypothetical protein
MCDHKALLEKGMYRVLQSGFNGLCRSSRQLRTKGGRVRGLEQLDCKSVREYTKANVKKVRRPGATTLNQD